ncbi:DUF2835 domain-containing protein [Chromatium okenii]|jgi:hypothetical protein|uniref:DUF2835 domain-containing protein n=1 Tax=Chromatium okenii TaxID=61644 RepID=A0A2S7XUA8_9GAMM|nr:DUF2835 domain-containing protein [Chromatium okenii]MBV5307921.1 DUF2835 domain-containing protein [Chromatium okenii]PQJ97103.1 DUF2835 domain-containing protein [Chromatium okenii]
MHRFYFRLAITAAQYQRYYQGKASSVVVKTHAGLNLSLPAAHLRRFITADGVHGDFCLTADAQHRMIALERVQSSS